ncbi:NrfD/PsrC family molybdoenzyme membrane anchor subunit [Lutibacter flavus]|uniref:Prokaryotic molybdopterin-containing oxidoreductase family, membrane subunit n=1 Tax=Lutibacter flavus TaxID=691689 RepID=A0A238XT13_9FLAO|nr:NrfD/PsrC family molybdoenzyme membrane anchor subunit [Lutibacter flavus]SNR61860.1 prokaryotic molybdopterin-containing oxidoreductase family, membrane subunit [Lutibacter flavus]
MKNYKILLNDLAPQKFGKAGILWTWTLIVISIAGIIAYIDQIIKGQVVTNMHDYALWGIYISNFVFFVATSFVGTVTVAVLRLTSNSWRTPIVRIAEIISLAAIIMAGITIMIDMGRPDRLLNLFIHGRLQSPIIWDVIIIPIYIIISLLLLYFPLLPDFALLKSFYKEKNPKLSKWYGKLSLNWTGSLAQKTIQVKSIQLIAVLIIPVGFMLQTIDAWLFSTLFRVGWDSTNMGAYFISGASVAGVGALVTVVYVLHKAYKLEDYITDFHFDKLGKFLVLMCLIYLYFNLNEYLIPQLTSKKEATTHVNVLLTGQFAPLFWFVIIGGLIIPIIVLLFKKGRKPFPMFLIGILVVVGSWWKRYLIVTPTLLHPFLPIQGVPESWHHYFPSFHEWLITSATLAMCLLIITVLVRYLPIVPIQRTADEQELLNNNKNTNS